MTSIVARISLLVAALAVTAAIGASSALADPPYNTVPTLSPATGPLDRPAQEPPADRRELRASDPSE